MGADVDIVTKLNHNSRLITVNWGDLIPGMFTCIDIYTKHD